MSDDVELGGSEGEKKPKKRGGRRPGAGRPKGSAAIATPVMKANLSAMARAHTQRAIEALVYVATSGQSESARVAAAIALLDRGYGKPQQAVEHSGPGGGPLVIGRIERVVIDPAGERYERIEYGDHPAAVVAGVLDAGWRAEEDEDDGVVLVADER